MMILLAIPVIILIVALVAAWKYGDDEDISWKELEKLEEDDREYWRK